MHANMDRDQMWIKNALVSMQCLARWLESGHPESCEGFRKECLQIWIEIASVHQQCLARWLEWSQGFLNHVKAFSSASYGTQMGNMGHASAASQGNVRNLQLYGPQVGKRGYASAAPQGSARNVYGVIGACVYEGSGITTVTTVTTITIELQGGGSMFRPLKNIRIRNIYIYVCFLF